MGKETGITWCHHTHNLVWGCSKVSLGCRNCYADTMSSRFGFDIWGVNKPRRTFGEKHWNDPIRWNREAGELGVRRRVFCGSMCDVYEDHETVNQEREKLWPLIAQTPHLDWLLLTKRPENIMRMSPWGQDWPDNVWAMTSVENQAVAADRVGALVEVPAVVRGLSVEPMIGPVDLSEWLFPEAKVDWVIVGGESGPGARPMNIGWARFLKAQCDEAGVAFFMKQKGAVWAREVDATNKKGEDINEWCEDLRVQNFPQPRLPVLV